MICEALLTKRGNSNKRSVCFVKISVQTNTQSLKHLFIENTYLGSLKVVSIGVKMISVMMISVTTKEPNSL